MSNFLHPANRTRRGAALVLVLSIIVLLAAVVVAFMSSARNDLSQVIQYEAGREAQSLAETATSIVMAQIREATLLGIATDGKGTHAWASQPGGIRVWNASGGLVQLYKLYSASRMKEDSLAFLVSEIPNGWWGDLDAYVDLNEPISKGAGGSSRWIYPILNPGALGTMTGFSSNQTGDPGAAWDTRASMPVRWLYISRTGEIRSSQQPDSIGRIAFWTDDETCKVNINTASATASWKDIISFPPGSESPGAETRLGYSYWDLPYTQLQQDWNMARSAPSQAEYQRYPGHPASVDLLTVLGGATFSGLPESQQKSILKSLFDLLPAYRWGGSENGRIPWTLMASRTPLSGTNQKSERLYASVDELRFSPGSSGGHRIENTLPGGVTFDETRLDDWRFFLTATSRAPDLNLFGQPRVTIWPIHATDDANHRTTQDQMIAFCSTYGPEGKEYFFQRKNPMSQTEDWTGIPRNQALFTYLQGMTSRDIPGFGGNFKDKYDAGATGERDQILTEIFDYIRCVNLNEVFEFKPAGFESYTPTIDVPPSAQQDVAAYNNWNLANFLSYKGAGMVLPIYIDHGAYSTRGAGRVPVLSEVALFAMQQGITPSNPGDAPQGSGFLQTALFFETFSPMQGYMPWTPKDFQLRAKTDMTIAGEFPFPNADVESTTPAFNRAIADISGHSTSQPAGGTDGFAWTMGLDFNFWGIYQAPAFARNLSTAIPIPPPPPVGVHKLEITAGTLKVDFLMAGTIYQNYELGFPSASLKIPDPSTPTGSANDNADWRARFGHNKGMEFKPQDVVHSLVPKDGDYRIIAYLQDVPRQFFRPHPDFGSNKNFAHSLRQRRYFGLMGTTVDDGTSNGTFVNLPYGKVDLSGGGFWTGSPSGYFWTDHPDIPPDITDLISAGWTGDWNNGGGDFPDGAYLGKSDDGYRSLVSSALYLNGEFNWYSGAGFFSPTQQMPSAVMFGSLPTGVKRTLAAYVGGNDANAAPWRTLLFCPNPAIGDSHFGFSSPADSLLLDLFTMPVVEPYAISEPTSTAGRINMNQQIIPFTKIQRTTGLHAVLASQRVTALPDSIAEIRDGHPLLATQGVIQANTTRIRHRIDASETLQQFWSRFSPDGKPENGDLFHSAAEICSIWLVPEGPTLGDTPNWWNSHRITGDNLRERPYATLYPLLTTKSNTFTVYMRAQSLAPETGKVTGEYRGSSVIERYIDPMDERLKSHDPDTKSLEPLYRFRVIETKRFAP